MAITRQGALLTETHQAAQLAVRARSIRGLLKLWRTIDPTRLSQTIEPFIEAATLLAGQGFRESADEAIRYFRSFRRIEGIRSAITLPVATPDTAAVASALQGAALSGIIDARRAGMTLPGAMESGFIRTAGALVKQVLAGGRMTIINGVDVDPTALGWVRTTDGDPCAFCRMLASRGAAYKTRQAAEFEAHDNCACGAEAVYPGRQQAGSPLLQSAVYRTEYDTAQTWAKESGTLSTGTSNDALNNLRRWLDNGKPMPGAEVTGVPGE